VRRVRRSADDTHAVMDEMMMALSITAAARQKNVWVRVFIK